MNQAVYTPHDHTFVVCAYKQSEYLRQCIESLVGQTTASCVILVTSTPNKSIEKLCGEFEIPLYINQGPHHGIAGDWNFGVAQTSTKLVTIAHQDDVYKPSYTADMLAVLNKAAEKIDEAQTEGVQHNEPSTHKEPLLYFTNYAELRDGHEITHNKLLRIKRLMLVPLRVSLFACWRWVRTAILGLGNPICCPSITLLRTTLDKLGREEFFDEHFGSNLDWQTWLMIAKLPGAFVYNPTIEMCHRIHEESETSRLIQNHAREDEDFEMLAKFWPRPIARLINVVYKKGQKSNRS